jgi:hypothetical protein
MAEFEATVKNLNSQIMRYIEETINKPMAELSGKGEDEMRGFMQEPSVLAEIASFSYKEGMTGDMVLKNLTSIFPEIISRMEHVSQKKFEDRRTEIKGEKEKLLDGLLKAGLLVNLEGSTEAEKANFFFSKLESALLQYNEEDQWKELKNVLKDYFVANTESDKVKEFMREYLSIYRSEVFVVGREKSLETSMTRMKLYYQTVTLADGTIENVGNLMGITFEDFITKGLDDEAVRARYSALQKLYPELQSLEKYDQAEAAYEAAYQDQLKIVDRINRIYQKSEENPDFFSEIYAESMAERDLENQRASEFMDSQTGEKDLSEIYPNLSLEVIEEIYHSIPLSANLVFENNKLSIEMEDQSLPLDIGEGDDPDQINITPGSGQGSFYVPLKRENLPLAQYLVMVDDSEKKSISNNQEERSQQQERMGSKEIALIFKNLFNRPFDKEQLLRFEMLISAGLDLETMMNRAGLIQNSGLEATGANANKAHRGLGIKFLEILNQQDPVFAFNKAFPPKKK